MNGFETTALRLLDARARATLVEPPSVADPGFDLPTAYAVGSAITARRRADGEQTVGRKIGFTNANIWAEYGVDAPLWAHIYASTLRHADDGEASIGLAATAAPRVEPEIVLGMRTAPTVADDPAALLRAVAWIALGFELVDCHFAGWRFTLADAVADFGLHGTLVVGTPLGLPADPDPAFLDALARCELVLSRNGTTVATGVGANALGSPILALGHLVRTLHAQEAEPLAAGEVITTGTLTPAFPVAPGETWTASVTGIDLAPLTLELVA